MIVRVSKSLFERVRIADREYTCAYCGKTISRNEAYIVIVNAPGGRYRGLKHVHLTCYCKIFRFRCRAIIEVLIRKYIIHNKSPDVEYFKKLVNELCTICECCK